MARRFGEIGRVLLGVVLWVAIAWAQVDYPVAVGKVVPQYPGSKVEMNMRVDKGTQVYLTTSDPAEKVFQFYKDALKEKGWESAMEMTHEGGYQSHWKKDKAEFHLVIHSEEEQTKIMLLLSIAE